MKSGAAFPALPMLATVLWGVTAAAPILRAQSANQDAARPAGVTLTDDSLHQMLTNMGYEPTRLTRGSTITVKRDTWTIPLQLVLSSDGTRLGLNANLGVVPNPENITADQWKKLLIANGEIDPSSFYLDKASNKLFLHRTLDNRAVDPAYLRNQIEKVCTNVKDTAALWQFGK